MAWTNPNSTTNNATSLVSQGRAQNQSVIGQDMNLFVFDAFEYDDSNKTDSPVLSMKEGWTFDVGTITTDQISNFTEEVEEASDTSDIYIKLDSIMKDIEILYQDSEWNSSQITVGQGEIDIRVTATEELGESLSESFVTLNSELESAQAEIGANTSGITTVTDELSGLTTTVSTNSSSIVTLNSGLTTANASISANVSSISNVENETGLLGNTVSKHSSAFINLGADIDAGSSITISADKIVLTGGEDLGNFMSVNPITGRVDIDGDIYAENGTFSGDISGASGTFSGNLSGSSITGSVIEGSIIESSVITSSSISSTGKDVSIEISDSKITSYYDGEENGSISFGTSISIDGNLYTGRIKSTSYISAARYILADGGRIVSHSGLQMTTRLQLYSAIRNVLDEIPNGDRLFAQMQLGGQVTTGQILTVNSTTVAFIHSDGYDTYTSSGGGTGPIYSALYI